MEPSLYRASEGWMDEWMGGWMTCDITSFSTVFQSYQDNGHVIMNGCVQSWTLFTVKKISP